MKTRSGASGPLLLDLPYTAEPPRLDNAGVGLPRMLSLAGRDEAYAADVTVIDVADHRLLRSGVELAHRVIDGLGDWYLRAPGWEPLLPAERIVPLGHGDLPDDLADLVMPFRRRGTLGPVAAISRERQSFEFRSGRSEAALARLTDDRVTVRRGGVTTARYREVRIHPGPAGLTAAQRGWLTDALQAAGGTRVEAFPPLSVRLGTPATGLTDYPEPLPLDPDAGVETFIGTVLAGRLRDLIGADLAGRCGDPAAADQLVAVGAGLRAELVGLAPVLAPEWLAELGEELRWFSGAVAEAGADQQRLRSTLRRERYLRMLDLLVTAVRGPGVVEERAQERAEVVLGRLLGAAVDRLLTAGGGLRPGSTSAAWISAAEAADQVRRLENLSRGVLTKRERRTAKRFRPAVATLLEIREQWEQAEEAQRQARFVTSAEAFDLGRTYQRCRQRLGAAQERFLDQWPEFAPARSPKDRG